MRCACAHFVSRIDFQPATCGSDPSVCNVREKKLARQVETVNVSVVMAPVVLPLFWAPSCALKSLWWSQLAVAGILTHGDATARLCWPPASRVGAEQSVGWGATDPRAVPDLYGERV